MGDEWKVFEGDANPLHDAYIVDTNSPSDVKPVAEEAKNRRCLWSPRRWCQYRTSLQVGFLHPCMGIGHRRTLDLYHPVFLISNTIRITIISRSREIQIMRLVGAKNSYIRGPFLLERCLYRIVGSSLPSALVYFIYNRVFQSVNPSLVGQNLSLITLNTFIPMMIGLLFLIGICIGSLGSGISMRRFLKI